MSKTSKVHFMVNAIIHSVLAQMDIRVMADHVMMLMNVSTVIMTAILTQLAAIPAAVLLVHVQMDILVMAKHVMMLMSV